MARRGFPDAAARIQELWLAGRKDEAVASVPDAYIEQNALFGSEARIRERWPSMLERGVTGLVVRAADPAAFKLAAELAGTKEDVT